MSFLVAEEAAKEPELVAFREQQLGRQVLALDDVARWVTKHAIEDGNGKGAGTLEYFGTEPWQLRQPTSEGGVLESLRSLSSRLARLYGWQTPQATTFILTGLTPMVAAIRSQIDGGIPFSCTTRIVLDVDPALSPREVMEHYGRVRGRLSAAGYPAVNDKQLKLAEFVAARSGLDPQQVLAMWNDQFPDWGYNDPDAFHHDAVLARRRLLDPW